MDNDLSYYYWSKYGSDLGTFIFELQECLDTNFGSGNFPISRIIKRQKRKNYYRKNSPIDTRPKFAIKYPKTSSNRDNDIKNVFSVLMNFSTIEEIKFTDKMIYVMFKKNFDNAT